jgi:hypothetical protein
MIRSAGPGQYTIYDIVNLISVVGGGGEGCNYALSEPERMCTGSEAAYPYLHAVSKAAGRACWRIFLRHSSGRDGRERGRGEGGAECPSPLQSVSGTGAV